MNHEKEADQKPEPRLQIVKRNITVWGWGTNQKSEAQNQMQVERDITGKKKSQQV